MCGIDFVRCAGSAWAIALVLVAPSPVLAYVGPGAGLELVGYFMGLLAWVAVAFGSILLWPLTNLIRRWRGKAEIKDEPKNETAAPGSPESPLQVHDPAQKSQGEP